MNDKQAQWPFRLKMPCSFPLPPPHPPVRLPHAVDEDWVKAEEKQPIRDEIKPKDNQPVKTLSHHRDHTVMASVWTEKQEGGNQPGADLDSFHGSRMSNSKPCFL